MERSAGGAPGAKRFGGLGCDGDDGDDGEFVSDDSGPKKVLSLAEGKHQEDKALVEAKGADRTGETKKGGEKELSESEGDGDDCGRGSGGVRDDGSAPLPVKVELPAARRIEISPSLLILKELLTRDIDQTIKMQLVEQVMSRHVDSVIAAEREVAHKSLQELAHKKERGDCEVRRLRERMSKAEKSAVKRKKQRDEAKHDYDVKLHECRRATEELLAEKRRCDQISSVTARLDDELSIQKSRAEKAEAEVRGMREALSEQQQQAKKLHEQTINAYKAELAKVRVSLECVNRQAILPSVALERACSLAEATLDHTMVLLASCVEKGETLVQQAKRLAEVEREVAMLRSDAGSGLIHSVSALLANFPQRVSFESVMPGDIIVHPKNPGIERLKSLVQRNHSGSRLQCVHRQMWTGHEVERLEQRIERILFKLESQSGRAEPIDMDYSGTEVRVIGDDDSRVALRGEFGLFSARNIKRGEVLGPYAGSLRTEREYAHKYSFVPELFARDAYSYRFSEQVSHPWTVLGPQGGDILAHSTTSDSVLLGECWSKDTNVFSDDHLLVDAYTSGNRFVFVNDFRRNPFKTSDEERQEELREPNVTFLEVMYKGWPYVLVVSISEVDRGEELLVDYGAQYWQQQRLREQQLGPLNKHILDLRRSLDAAEKKLMQQPAAKSGHAVEKASKADCCKPFPNSTFCSSMSFLGSKANWPAGKLSSTETGPSGTATSSPAMSSLPASTSRNQESVVAHLMAMASYSVKPVENGLEGDFEMTSTARSDACRPSALPTKRQAPLSAQQYPSACKRGKGLARALPRSRVEEVIDLSTKKLNEMDIASFSSVGITPCASTSSASPKVSAATSSPRFSADTCDAVHSSSKVAVEGYVKKRMKCDRKSSFGMPENRARSQFSEDDASPTVDEDDVDDIGRNVSLSGKKSCRDEQITSQKDEVGGGGGLSGYASETIICRGAFVLTLFDDGKWWPGKVKCFQERSGVAKIVYEDGDVQEIRLPDDDVRPIDYEYNGPLLHI